jgi:hypothetical protein
MIKYLPHSLLLLALLIVPASSAVVTSGGYVSSGAGQYAVNINSATTLTVPAGTGIAEICIETQAARYRDDGGVPTTSSGVPVAAGSCFQYAGPLNKIQFIGQTTGATMDVSYYKSSG